MYERDTLEENENDHKLYINTCIIFSISETQIFMTI